MCGRHGPEPRANVAPRLISRCRAFRWGPPALDAAGGGAHLPQSGIRHEDRFRDCPSLTGRPRSSQRFQLSSRLRGVRWSQHGVSRGSALARASLGVTVARPITSPFGWARTFSVAVRGRAT